LAVKLLVTEVAAAKLVLPACAAVTETVPVPMRLRMEPVSIAGPVTV
jgi:hypothetical protein